MNKNCVVFSKNEVFIKKIIDNITVNNQFLTTVQIYSEKELAGATNHAFHVSEIHSDNLNKIMAEFNAENILLVVVDADKMYKRHNSAFAKIQHLLRVGGKVIIQHLPYIVNAWKIYYPYSCIDKRLLKYPHSYAFEQDCQNYFNDMRESDPCDIARITENICDITAIDYERYFEASPIFNVVPVSDGAKKEYQEIKESLFTTDDIGISQIKKKLYKFAQSSVFGHNLPIDLKKIYANKNVVFTCSNLPIDNWICGEITKLVKHTNELTEVLYGKSLYK